MKFEVRNKAENRAARSQIYLAFGFWISRFLRAMDLRSHA